MKWTFKVYNVHVHWVSGVHKVEVLHGKRICEKGIMVIKIILRNKRAAKTIKKLFCANVFVMIT